MIAWQYAAVALIIGVNLGFLACAMFAARRVVNLQNRVRYLEVELDSYTDSESFVGGAREHRD